MRLHQCISCTRKFRRAILNLHSAANIILKLKLVQNAADAQLNVLYKKLISLDRFQASFLNGFSNSKKPAKKALMNDRSSNM